MNYVSRDRRGAMTAAATREGHFGGRVMQPALPRAAASGGSATSRRIRARPNPQDAANLRGSAGGHPARPHRASDTALRNTTAGRFRFLAGALASRTVIPR